MTELEYYENFAKDLRDFMQIEENLKNNNFELIKSEEVELIRDQAKEALEMINEDFPELDEKVIEYSLHYDMRFLIDIKKLKLILEKIIKHEMA